MTYTYEGIELVESGDVRYARIGDFYLHAGEAVKATTNHTIEKTRILIPKGESMDEYNIPVLVKADARQSGVDRCNTYRGRLFMGKFAQGIHWGPSSEVQPDQPEGINWIPDDLILWPTQAEYEAEAQKLKAMTEKRDPVPQVVRDHLKASNSDVCTGARAWAHKLITLIYENPPHV